MFNHEKYLTCDSSKIEFNDNTSRIEFKGVKYYPEGKSIDRNLQITDSGFIITDYSPTGDSVFSQFNLNPDVLIEKESINKILLKLTNKTEVVFESNADIVIGQSMYSPVQQKLNVTKSIKMYGDTIVTMIMLPGNMPKLSSFEKKITDSNSSVRNYLSKDLEIKYNDNNNFMPRSAIMNEIVKVVILSVLFLMIFEILFFLKKHNHK